ncbi:MAG: hypothetical protein MJK04_17440 [Psychrosphaera sp.]|nr:hypothetical protein [Psychrosphaera sp.]
MPKKNNNRLVVIERNSMKPVIAFGFNAFEFIGQFHWANNARLIYSKKYQLDSQEKHINRGELFAANIDGTKRVQLFGRGANHNNNHSKIKTKKTLQAYGTLAHMLPNDPNHILVTARKLSQDGDAPKRLYKININNQKRTLITKTPLGNFDVILNSQGEPVIGSGKDRKGKKHKYWFTAGQWQLIDKSDSLHKYSFLSVNKDVSKLYIKRVVKKPPPVCMPMTLPAKKSPCYTTTPPSI